VDIPSRTGVLQSGNRYSLLCEADAPATFLVLNVDRDGMVSVLAPTTAGEMVPRRRWEFPNIQATPPEGTEFVKVFAFTTPPPWLGDWLAAQVRGTDSPSLSDLVKLVSGTDSVAEARLKIVTVR
jgi:hypothetical protein